MALTVTAGTPATATQYNALIPRIYQQASDQSLTTVSAAVNFLNGLAIPAGEVWYCELLFDYGNFSTATNNVQLSWDSPTGTVTMSRIFTVGVAAGTGSVTDTNGAFQSRVQNTSISYSGTLSTSVRGCARQVFTVDGGASGGTITLRVVMSAGTGTSYTGSTLFAHRYS